MALFELVVSFWLLFKGLRPARARFNRRLERLCVSFMIDNLHSSQTFIRLMKRLLKWILRLVLILLVLAFLFVFVAYWRSTNDCDRQTGAGSTESHEGDRPLRLRCDESQIIRTLRSLRRNDDQSPGKGSRGFGQSGMTGTSLRARHTSCAR